MRFNSPAEVMRAASLAAYGDVQRYLAGTHALNQYCTPGARDDFERGFKNMGPRPYENQCLDWNFRYWRGRLAAEILEIFGEVRDDEA